MTSELFKGCLTNSTAHALPKIVRGKSLFVRLLWSFCFVVCTSYCIYSLVLSTKEFFKYPSYAKIELVQDKIPTDFPSVTFCNLKNFEKTRVQQYFDEIEEKLPQTISDLKVNHTSLMHSYIALYELRSKLLSINNNSEEMLTKHGYQISDMLLSCHFNYVPCDVNDFVTSYDSFYGNCFTFNSGKYANGSKSEIKKVGLQGPEFALSMEIFTGNPDIQTQFEVNDGLMVFIQKHAATQYTIRGDRVLVSTGAETDIKIKKNVMYKLPHPYGNCINNTDPDSNSNSLFFDHIVRKLKRTYNQEFCHLLCTQKQINKQCNCSYVELPIMENLEICHHQHQLICLIEIVNLFRYDGRECELGCPLPCSVTKYDILTSRAFYPNKYYKKLLIKNEKLNSSGIAFEDLDQAVLRFSVFYESMVYTKTQEYPSITTETFIATIGGTVGFYLGISILTFVEIIEFLSNLIQLFFKRYLNKRIEHLK